MSTLLVSSGGGHFQQLLALQERMGLPDEAAWVTPASGLTDRLDGQKHFEIPYLPARDWRGAAKLTREASRIIAESGAERIISTGAAPAVPFFLAGARKGLDLHYVETATRSLGPSLSGRLVSMVPGASLYTQYQQWSGPRWHFRGSIFDAYSYASRPAPEKLTKIVVSLGTEKFDFGRALRALLRVLPGDAEILWQTGATDAADLPIEARATVPANELRQAISEADLFISHAGTGSALTAFELGKLPLLLPREARHGEHVDDHQMLTADELSQRGLAISARVDELSWEHLFRASTGRVVSDGVFRPFQLTGLPTPQPALDLRTAAPTLI